MRTSQAVSVRSSHPHHQRRCNYSVQKLYFRKDQPVAKLTRACRRRIKGRGLHKHCKEHSPTARAELRSSRNPTYQRTWRGRDPHLVWLRRHIYDLVTSWQDYLLDSNEVEAFTMVEGWRAEITSQLKYTHGDSELPIIFSHVGYIPGKGYAYFIRSEKFLPNNLTTRSFRGLLLTQKPSQLPFLDTTRSFSSMFYHRHIQELLQAFELDPLVNAHILYQVGLPHCPDNHVEIMQRLLYWKRRATKGIPELFHMPHTVKRNDGFLPGCSAHVSNQSHIKVCFIVFPWPERGTNI
jgi:hypothetical protein